MVYVDNRAIATNDDNGTVRTITATAKTLSDLGFSKADIERASSVLVHVYDENVLWYCDGTTPVVSGNRGHLITAGTSLTLDSDENVNNLSMIAVTGTATVAITLFGG